MKIDDFATRDIKNKREELFDFAKERFKVLRAKKEKQFAVMIAQREKEYAEMTAKNKKEYAETIAQSEKQFSEMLDKEEKEYTEYTMCKIEEKLKPGMPPFIDKIVDDLYSEDNEDPLHIRWTGLHKYRQDYIAQQLNPLTREQFETWKNIHLYNATLTYDKSIHAISIPTLHIMNWNRYKYPLLF